jgi:DNA-binding CsgD family transcriptional regulator
MVRRAACTSSSVSATRWSCAVGRAAVLEVQRPLVGVVLGAYDEVVLLGRNREVQLLTDLVAAANAEGRVVLIRGEAGVGKTSLVHALIEQVGGEARCVVGSCDDLYTPQPLAPFHDMARSEPSIARPLAAGDRYGVFGAALEVLARPSPVTVMVIEDVQWAGEATLDAIKFLGRRIGDTGGVLVLTYRDDEVDVDHPLRAVLGAIPPGSVTRIRLEGLSADAVAVMLEGTPHDVATVMALTDGNPLFVSELAATAEGEIPTSIADLVLVKITHLGEPARQFLRSLSVIPQPIPVSWARQLVDNADELLAESTASSLIELDETVRFRHELVRRVIEASLGVLDRVAVNRAVLATPPPDVTPAQMAHHALGSDDPAAVLEYVPAAATVAAAVESYREACQLYRALEPHLDLLDLAKQGELLDGHGRAALRGGPVEDALRIQQRRVAYHKERDDARRTAAALADLAEAYYYANSVAEARQVALEALKLADGESDSGEQLSALSVLCWLSLMDLDLEGTRLWATRAMRVADESDHEGTTMHCVVDLASAEALLRYPAGKDQLVNAARQAARRKDWWNTERAWHNLAVAAIEALDLSTAADAVQHALDAEARYQGYAPHNYAAAIHAKLLETRGAWAAAEQEASNLFDDCGRRAAALPITLTCLPFIGVIEARMGRPDAAETLTSAWQLATETASPARAAPVVAALAEYAWISDDDNISLGTVEAVLAAALETVPRWRSTGLLALWLWELGRLEHDVAGIAEPYRLVIDGEPLRAAEVFAEIGLPYEHALALSHGPLESRLLALEELQALGATAVVDRLHQDLRAEGVRLPRGRARTTRDHVAGLTSRQAEVLELIAEGLSNPEIANRLFVSPRTVEHHVSAILTKLGVSTRQAAADKARAAGMTPA